MNSSRVFTNNGNNQITQTWLSKMDWTCTAGRGYTWGTQYLLTQNLTFLPRKIQGVEVWVDRTEVYTLCMQSFGCKRERLLVHLVYLKHTEAYCHWRKRNSNKNSSDQKDHKFLQMTALLQILRQLAISPNTWSTVETPWASKCILCTPCNLFSIRFTNQIRTLNPYPKFISWYRTLSTRAYLWLIQITFDVETQTV